MNRALVSRTKKPIWWQDLEARRFFFFVLFSCFGATPVRRRVRERRRRRRVGRSRYRADRPTAPCLAMQFAEEADENETRTRKKKKKGKLGEKKNIPRAESFWISSVSNSASTSTRGKKNSIVDLKNHIHSMDNNFLHWEEPIGSDFTEFLTNWFWKWFIELGSFIVSQLFLE